MEIGRHCGSLPLLETVHPFSFAVFAKRSLVDRFDTRSDQGTSPIFKRYRLALHVERSSNLWRMNKRDQELLDKQLGRIVPGARHDGIMILTVVAVFFVGLALGAILFPRGIESHKSRQMRPLLRFPLRTVHDRTRDHSSHPRTRRPIR